MTCIIENKSKNNFIINLGFRIEAEPRETFVLKSGGRMQTGFDKVVINDE